MSIIGQVTGIGQTQCEVTIYRGTACGAEGSVQCASCPSASPVQVLADNNGWQPSVGQLVKLYSTQRGVVRLAAVTYLLPLVTGVTGYAVTERLLGLPEGAAAFSALGCFLAGFLPAYLIDRRMASDARLNYSIEDLLDQLPIGEGVPDRFSPVAPR